MKTFELWLSPIDDRQFKVIVTESPVGEGEIESSLPFFIGERDWRMTVLRSLELTEFNPKYFSDVSEQNWLVNTGILNEDRNDFNRDYLVEIGQQLYQAMFPSASKVRDLLQAALRSVETDNQLLHIRLKFEEDVVQRSRLADYPWELLHDGQRFLLHQQVNISRYIAYKAVPPNLSPVEQVNVLLVSSAAFDTELGLKKLSKREQQAISKGLESASEAGDINLTELDYPTIDELRKYLTEHHQDQALHVLHFDGHGLFGKRCSKCRAMNKGIRVEKCRKCQAQLSDAQGYLVFEDENGGADYVSAKELGVLLRETSFREGTGVTVVVLSACQSAMTIEGDSVFNGTAQNLISQRVPAVIAMQYSVRVDAATQFAEQFYRSLGQKNSISVAVSQGREAMGVEENQWYRPVLYLRWKDNAGGQLFKSPVDTMSINSPFVSAEDFFKTWMSPEKPFNHSWELVGRSDELKQLEEFISSSQHQIAIISGRGGIGKTKLLHAFSQKILKSEVILKFIAEGREVTVEDIKFLPKQPCILLLDDAHRREEELSTLLVFIQKSSFTKLLLSSRPYACERIGDILRQNSISSGQIQKLEILEELKLDDVKNLARQALGNEYSHLADKLAYLTKDCPLVTVVGGRLIAEKAINPNLLERNEDFQHDVLGRFRDALLGQLGEKIESKPCTELLQLIAAVQPINLRNEDFKEVAAEFLEIKSQKLVNHLGYLQEAGLLVRRGDLLRITPDVLADHILYEACITPQADSTGFHNEIFEKFQSVCLGQVLHNLSELDWRVNISNQQNIHLLTRIWYSIQQEFKSASDYDRSRLLEDIEKVAYYQPQEALQIVELTIRDLNTLPETRQSQEIISKLAVILQNIGYRIEYLPRSCDLLWKLAQEDTNQVNLSPSPLSILKDFSKYEIDKSLEFNQGVLDAVKRWFSKKNIHQYKTSPLDIVDIFLLKVVQVTQFENFTVRESYCPVIKEKTQEIRVQALSLVEKCLNSNNLKAKLRSLESLGKALEIDFRLKQNDLHKQWIPEQLEILKLIEYLVRDTSNPIIQIKIIEILHSVTDCDPTKEVRSKSKYVMSLILKSDELNIYKVILDKHNWSRNKESYEQFHENIVKLRLDVAKQFLEKYPNSNEGIKKLEEYLKNIEESGLDSTPGLLLELLSKLDHIYAAELCERIIENPSSRLSLHLISLLPQIRLNNVEQAISITQRSVATGNLDLCNSIAQFYAKLIWTQNPQPDDFDLIENLLNHSQYQIKAIAIGCLRSIANCNFEKFIALALTVDLGNSTKLAEEFFKIFHPHYGVNVENLNDRDLRFLLNKLELITRIEDILWIYPFIWYASKRVPRSVVQLLLNRIEINELEDNKDYQPLSYGKEFFKYLIGLSESNEYESLLRLICDQSIQYVNKKSFLISRLFKAVSLNFCPVTLKILEEWIETKEPSKIKAVGILLRDAPQDFVFKNVDFVSRLIEQAYELGDECYCMVCSALRHDTISGVCSGILGEPFPEDIEIINRATQIADELMKESPSQRFYSSLADSAKFSTECFRKIYEETFEMY